MRKTFTKPAALAFLEAIEEIMPMPLPSETAVITDSVLASSSVILSFEEETPAFSRMRSISFRVPEVSSRSM
jgi:hypothetical protein